MDNAYRILTLIKVLSMSCCFFRIPSNAELTTVHATVEKTVFLFCKNESLASLSQLIWTKDTTKLVTFASQTQIHWHPEAYSLQINMSLSQATLYALQIDKVQKNHDGNYMCETTTGSGVWEKNWILIVTDKDIEETEKSSLMLIIIISTIGVGVIFVVCLTILLFRHLKQRNRQSDATEMVNTVYEFRSYQKQHDIYENCLEGRHCQSHHIYSN